MSNGSAGKQTRDLWINRQRRHHWGKRLDIIRCCEICVCLVILQRAAVDLDTWWFLMEIINDSIVTFETMNFCWSKQGAQRVERSVLKERIVNMKQISAVMYDVCVMVLGHCYLVRQTVGVHFQPLVVSQVTSILHHVPQIISILLFKCGLPKEAAPLQVSYPPIILAIFKYHLWWTEILTGY